MIKVIDQAPPARRTKANWKRWVKYILSLPVRFVLGGVLLFISPLMLLVACVLWVLDVDDPWEPLVGHWDVLSVVLGIPRR